MDALDGAKDGARLAPLVGWRAWWLHRGRLHSWNLDYVWPAGTARAECRAGRLIEPHPPVSHQAPGQLCHCGFWALWDLSACLDRARRERVLPAPGHIPVIGVITGWGDVALHGEEGFRTEYAQIACLIANPVWDAAFDAYSYRPTGIGRVLRRAFPVLAAGRVPALRRAATHYGVPVVPLGRAIDIGLLGELGARTS